MIIAPTKNFCDDENLNGVQDIMLALIPVDRLIGEICANNNAQVISLGVYVFEHVVEILKLFHQNQLFRLRV